MWLNTSLKTKLWNVTPELGGSIAASKFWSIVAPNVCVNFHNLVKPGRLHKCGTLLHYLVNTFTHVWWKLPMLSAEYLLECLIERWSYYRWNLPLRVTPPFFFNQSLSHVFSNDFVEAAQKLLPCWFSSNYTLPSADEPSINLYH